MQPKMRNLHRTAKEAYQSFTSMTGGTEHRMEGCEVIDGELKFFFGHTRVVDKGQTRDRSRSRPRSAPSGSGASTSAGTPSSGGSSVPRAELAPAPTRTPRPYRSQASALSAPMASTSATSYIVQPYPPAAGLNDNDFLTTLNAGGWPQDPSSLMQGNLLTAPLILTPGQSSAQQQWQPEDWDPASIPQDTTFSQIMAANKAQPVFNWELPATWVNRAMEPLHTPSPETGQQLLPGKHLDETWQRFLDGIGLDDSGVQSRQ